MLCRTLQEDTASSATAVDTNTVAQPKPLFVEGKFDQFVESAQPFSAFISAFDALANAVWSEMMAEQQQQEPQSTTTGIETIMTEALLYEGSVLTKIIPSFRRFAADDVSVESADSSSNTTTAVLAAERLAVATISFLKVFCT